MKPTFMGIGSARCGSTWLHKTLGLHPEVSMSNPKQLQFFEKNMLTNDLEWYWQFFDTPEGETPRKVMGEVTPFYCRLDRRYVANIHRLLPDLKIVLTIRNPVDRIWSNAKLDFSHFKHRNLDAVSVGTFIRYAARARTRRYTDYEKMINCWSDVFGREAVHVELFDDLVSEPAPLLQRIYAHIGADPTWEPPADLIAQRVLPEGSDRKTREMPEEIRWYLSFDWLGRMRRLNDRLDGRVSKWVEEMEAVAANGRPRWRVRRNLNRAVLAMPEKLAYAGYETFKNYKLDRRWRLFLGDSR